MSYISSYPLIVYVPDLYAVEIILRLETRSRDEERAHWQRAIASVTSQDSSTSIHLLRALLHSLFSPHPFGPSFPMTFNDVAWLPKDNATANTGGDIEG